MQSEQQLARAILLVCPEVALHHSVARRAHTCQRMRDCDEASSSLSFEARSLNRNNRHFPELWTRSLLLEIWELVHLRSVK